jgi:hypothetical protein
MHAAKINMLALRINILSNLMSNTLQTVCSWHSTANKARGQGCPQPISPVQGPHGALAADRVTHLGRHLGLLAGAAEVQQILRTFHR